MTNTVEAITSILKSFVDKDPKPHLHVGEVMSIWTSLTAFQEARALYQIGLNMTVDEDLRHVLENALEGSSSDVELLHKFMKKEGIPMPAMGADKTKAKNEDVPEGVKINV